MAERVLLFNTAAHPDRAARLHASTCPMVNTSRAKSGRQVVKRIEGAELDDTIDDLNERGFPVKSCKCLRGVPLEEPQDEIVTTIENFVRKLID